METAILAILLLLGCFVGFGVGVLFFGKTANRQACGSVPEAKHEDCPSQKAGICPVEDLSGTISMAKRSQISFPNPEKATPTDPSSKIIKDEPLNDQSHSHPSENTTPNA